MATSPPAPPRNTDPPSKGPAEVRVPQDQGTLEKAASPITTLSSHLDPYPDYLMAGACALGGVYAYTKLKDPKAAGIAAIGAAAYIWSGQLLHNGNPRVGYDLGTVSSLALLAAVGPKAYNVGEASSVALASLGGISSVAHLLKSYQYRTGKPHELDIRGTGK